MGQNVEITLDAKEAGAVRAWLALQRAVDGYSASLGQVDEATAKNAKAAAEFDRAHAQAMNNAKRVLESLMTPQQKYHQSLESLASLHNRGLLSTEQYLQAMNKEKAALDAGDPAIQQEIQRKKQLEAAGRSLTAATQTATERYRTEIGRLNELKQSGAISEETYARAVRKSREELLSASGHVSKREQAEDRLQKELVESQRAEEQRAAVAKRVLQEIQTPQQRYNDKVKELTALKKEGRLTEEQFASAVRRSRAELDASTKAGNDGASMAGTFATKLVGMAAAVGGVTAIASRLKAEYDDLLQRQGKAGESQVTLAAAQRGAVINLGGDKTLTPETMVAELRKVSAATGVSESDVTRTFSDMLSARGQMDAKSVLPFLAGVLKMAPDQAGQPMMGGATLDLAKEFGANPQQALGMMMQVQSASRVTDLNSIAQSVVPAMVSIAKFGDNAEQAGELVATLTQASADKTGMSSSTAAVQLAGRLRKLLPKLANTEERIEAVRGSKSLQAKLFKDDFGEERFKPIFKQLLTGDENAAAVQAYRGSQATVTGADQAAATADTVLAQYEALPTAQTAAANRTLQSGADRARNVDIFGGRSGVVRKGIEDLLEANNVPLSVRNLTLSKFDLSTQLGRTDPLGEGAGILESQARFLGGGRPQAMSSGVAPSMGGAITVAPTRLPTADEARQAAAMAEVAKSLRELKESLDKNNAEVNQNNRNLDQANRGGSNKPNTTPAAPVPSASNSTPSGRP